LSTNLKKQKEFVAASQGSGLKTISARAAQQAEAELQNIEEVQKSTAQEEEAIIKWVQSKKENVNDQIQLLEDIKAGLLVIPSDFPKGITRTHYSFGNAIRYLEETLLQ